MLYKIAEKFKSIQGEGAYAGVPMAFIRFVGCSVGKRICQHCDTDFEAMHNWRGGGEFTASALLDWVGDYQHICLTGGEPLDQDLTSILYQGIQLNKLFHVETSGTKPVTMNRTNMWVCISPKPGFLEAEVLCADEVKVIVPGLGNMTSAQVDEIIRKIKGEGYQCGPGEFEDYARAFRWPTLSDALRWADAGKVVYLQPRNGKFDIDQNNLRIVQDIITLQPSLRLSVQMHKILKVQ